MPLLVRWGPSGQEYLVDERVGDGDYVRVASGDTAPLGPAADRAREEALKLVRDEAVRGELAADPAQMSAVRDLIKGSGIAA